MIPQPHFFTAQGFGKGGDYEGDATPLIEKCRAAGVRTVFVQISRARTIAWSARQIQLHNAGLYVVGWDDFQANPINSKAASGMFFDAVCAQVESAGQRDAAAATFKAGLAFGKPRGIVTTYSGLEQGQWAQLEAVGASFCVVECYRSDTATHAEIDRMLAQGTVYNIPVSSLIPVMGTWHGEQPRDYSWSAWSRNFGMWLAEQQPATVDAAWNMAGRLYWHLRAGNVLLHSEWATSYGPGDDGLTRMLSWAQSNEDAIRAVAHVELVRETGIA